MNRVLLFYASVIGLDIMCFAIGAAMYHSAQNIQSNLVSVTHTVFIPLCLIPMRRATAIGIEMRKRQY